MQMESGQRVDRYKVYADQNFRLKRNWSLGFGADFTYVHDHDNLTYTKVEGGASPTKTLSDLREYTTDFYVSLGKSYASGTSFSISATGESYKLGTYRR